MMETLSSSVLAWLLTYLIHSTVLLGLALVLTRARTWAPAALDLMWKTALVGSLATSTAQLALEVRPAGSVALRPALEAPASFGPTSAHAPDAAALRPDATGDVEESLSTRPLTPSSAGTAEASRSALPSLHSTAVLAWALVALTLGLAYAARRLILVGRIGDRVAVLDGRLLAELDLLSREAGLRRRPRLTSTSRISSPIALGVSEICVPETALTDLDLEQQRSMLAHELAHLARRDPLWLAFASLVERVLWIQPLNRIARRQIATSAEYLCDEWAVRRTGSGVALARCLAQVAEWIQSSPLGVPVAGMAEERSLLVSRVERLLAARGAAPRSPRALMPAAAIVVFATIAIAPSVTGSAARASATVDPSSVSTPLQSPSRPEPLASTPATPAGDETNAPRSALASQSAADATSSAGGRALGSRATRDSAVVVALIARLKDESADVRRAAANALGQLEDPRAVPALIEALSDEAARVRAAAADALGEFQDPRAVNRLSALLADPDREVRKNALEALSEYESGIPANAVLPLTRDPDTELRHAAAHALGKMSDRSAGPALAMLVRDPAHEVRAAAIESIGELRDAAHASAILPALGDSHAEVRRQALEALEELRSPIPEATLLALLRDPNAEVRAAAADLAGERSVIGAIPALRRLLDDPHEDVREEAVSALGDIAHDDATDALRAALTSKDAKIRRAAAEALGEGRQ